MKKIGIIGAGASGLVTGKVLTQDEHEVVIFEKDEEIGGVWASSRRYPGVTTQNTKDTFSFSDFPIPDSYDERPTGEQMLAYLKAYAEHNDLTSRIRLRTEVVPASPFEHGWRVDSRSVDEEQTQSEDFDFLVVCNGIYSQPKMPSLPGREEFEALGGRVFHSTSFHDLEAVAGKKTLVIGFAKSACDIALETSSVAERTTLLFRHGNYLLPRSIAGVHINSLFFTRFSGMFFPYWRKNFTESFLHSWAGRPLLGIYWRTVRRVLQKSTGLDRKDIFPTGAIERSFSCSTPLSPNGFFEKIRSGKIEAKQGSIERFVPGGVVLTDGEKIEVDRIIFATGFRHETPFFDDRIERQLRDASGRRLLFRNILPVDMLGLIFNGYNSSIFTHLTSEIAAVWLSEHIADRLVLPHREEMLTEMDLLEKSRAKAGRKGSAPECIVSFVFQYIEDLLHDLELSPRRTGRFIDDWLKPIQTADYAGLKAELNRLHGFFPGA